MKRLILTVEGPRQTGKTTFLNYLRKILMQSEQFKIISINERKHQAVIEPILTAFPKEEEEQC